MKTEYLQYFLCASESESLSKAAEQLHMSQQGLSRVIKILECEYGMALFARSNSRSTLTAAGKELRTHAKSVVDEYERLERHMRNSSRIEKSRETQLTLYMTLNVMHHVYPLLSQAIGFFFPHWGVRIVEIDQKSLISKVHEENNASSVFLVSVPYPVLVEYAKDSQTVFYPLIDTELDVMVASNSSLADKKTFKWEELEEVKLAFLKDEGMIDLLRRKRFCSLLDKSDIWISNNKILEALMMSDDIATFSTSFLSHCSNHGSFTHIPLEDTFPTPIGFFSEKGRNVIPEAIEFERCIESYIAKHYPDILFARGAVVARKYVPRTTRPED